MTGESPDREALVTTFSGGDAATRALVVYESMFGNTKAIAEAVAFGLAGDVELAEVGTAPTDIASDVGLVVVGGPTHAFGMSRPATRRSATEASGGPVMSERIGIQEWLGEISALSTTAVAVFDTRIDRPRIPGSAARAANRRLRRIGLPAIVAPESFYVLGTSGPLKDGERSRAVSWGAHLASLVRPVFETVGSLERSR
jgi:hypothetical protein